MSRNDDVRRKLGAPKKFLPNVRLIRAIKYKDFKGARQALLDGADPNCVNDEGHHILFLAFAYSDEILELLINWGDTNLFVNNGDHQNILHLLAQYGMNDLIIKVLDKGVDINSTDISSKTPLYYAIQFKQFDTVKLFLDRNAVVDDEIIRCSIRNIDTEGNLQTFQLLMEKYQVKIPRYSHLVKWTIENDNVVIFNYLNQYYTEKVKNSINFRCKDGATLLHRVNDITIAKILLGYGIDINAVDTAGGNTAMFYLGDDSLELAQLYLDYGIDLTIKNKQRLNVIQFMFKNKHPKLANLLKEWQDSVPDIKVPEDN